MMARKPIRRDEAFAQEALTRYLHSQGFSHLLWEEPDQDPPDFFLTVDGQRHAVEVTQVMDSVELGGRVISDRGVVSALRQTVATLEEAAKKRKVLRASITCMSVHFPISGEPYRRLNPGSFAI
jgi:hypothetical protein